jgi:hypothetical protein
MRQLIRDIVCRGELSISPGGVTAKGGLAILALFVLSVVVLVT